MKIGLGDGKIALMFLEAGHMYAKEDLEFQPYLGATPGEARLSPLEFEKLDREKVNNIL